MVVLHIPYQYEPVEEDNDLLLGLHSVGLDLYLYYFPHILPCSVEVGAAGTVEWVVAVCTTVEQEVGSGIVVVVVRVVEPEVVERVDEIEGATAVVLLLRQSVRYHNRHSSLAVAVVRQSIEADHIRSLVFAVALGYIPFDYILSDE